MGVVVILEENLISVITDFFAGAADSTSATMAYACLWLVIHQDVQEKCYQEIVKTIGTDRLPRVWDRMEYEFIYSEMAFT